MVLLFENGFSGWGQFLQSFCRSTREYVISRVAKPRVIWQIHLCSCKSFAKIVPVPKNYISVLARKLNSGRSYLITAIYYKYSITIWVFIVWVWISSIITLSLILFFGKIVQKNQLELITFNSFSPLHCGVKGRSYFYLFPPITTCKMQN